MNQNDLLERIQNLLLMGNRIVECPAEPIVIPGIGTGAAYIANDVMGTLVKIAVPKSGEIRSATFWDMDDEGLQYDLEIFKHSITQVADNGAWALSDIDSLGFVHELNFVSFDDHGVCQTSKITNIGVAYTAPEGYLYVQCVARGAHNIAAGNEPRFQIQIMPVPLDY